MKIAKIHGVKLNTKFADITLMENISDENSSAEQLNSDNYAQWDRARALVGQLSQPPRFITAAIHFLRLDTENNGDNLSHLARNCIIPLLRTDSFKATVYYSAKTFYPERLEGKKFETPRKLTSLYQPSEFIALTAIMYLYRRFRKECDKEAFTTFVNNVSHNWIMSGAVGRAIERIGFANALIYNVFPHLAQSFFLKDDQKKFKAYRVHLRQKNIQFDIQYEEEKWGCNCLQLGVLLAQHLGLGKHYHDPIILGVGSPSLEAAAYEPVLYGAKLIQVWIDSLNERGDAPDMPHRGEFYPYSTEMTHLIEFVKNSAQSNQELHFFQRTGEDITEDKAPELYSESSDEETELTEIESGLPSDIQGEILDSLAEDNILDS